MSHGVFIAAAYGVAVLGLGALALWLVLDNLAQRRALKELEARGIRRRSDAARAGASETEASKTLPPTLSEGARERP